MIYLERGITPTVLADTAKVKAWTEEYVQKREEWERGGKKGNMPRPLPTRYGHKEVRDRLIGMSAGKCFYCESKLHIDHDESGKEVTNDYQIDHYEEVATNPDLAYDWSNLYLSCKHCNSKFSSRVIPNNVTLDPCSSLYVHAENITFSNEVIIGLTERGNKTIEKYKLWKLETRRAKQLSALKDTLLKIRSQQIEEGRKTINAEETKILQMFQAKEYPFSMMFTVYLAKHNL